MVKPSKMTDQALLFSFSNVLSQINQLYKEKKELEEEIARRNEFLRQQYQRGEIKLEQEADNGPDNAEASGSV